jgi:hypothetical protein
MKTLLLTITAACVNLVASSGAAFTVPTHRDMNLTAANTDADFVSMLHAELGFPDGRNQTFRGRNVAGWIRYGGECEDDWTPVPDIRIGRFNRHFHDPLEPWTSAGLVLPILGQFDSSVIWMQIDDGGDAGSGGQAWSWPDARRSYYNALTLQRPQARDQKWADTFRAIGQVMHLVEDAAQPAHTRNDSHASGAICHDWLHLDCGANLEYWVQKNFVVTGGGNGFDINILS